jgi:hypothetical protein
MSANKTLRYRLISQERVGEILTKGFLRRDFFAHKIFHLPKAGPDGLLMANRLCQVRKPNQLWELSLYATSPALDEFPNSLFFDDDLMWHRQQYGMAGLVATANLAVQGNFVFGTNLISDLVQRISRRREFKTRIESRFHAWPVWLLHAILNFARERGLTEVRIPTADCVVAHADPSRTVKRELFDRVYDRSVHRWFRSTQRGDWWVLNVAENLDRLVVPKACGAPLKQEKTICVCHDLERGWGHRGVDRSLAEEADRNAAANLGAMMQIEQRTEVRATYNVVGRFYDEVRDALAAEGHCTAFHSYDHRIDRWWPVSRWCRALISDGSDQLTKLRRIDYRIKGYRPPQSRLTLELRDANLCRHNFEWLASSTHSLKTNQPLMENRLVKIPVHFDDCALYRREFTYGEWEQNALESIRAHEVAVFSLHDCYAPFWLPHYQSFLEKIRSLGELATLDEVATQMIWSCSQ